MPNFSFLRTLPALVMLVAVPAAFGQTLVNVYVQAGSGSFAANGANDTALDLRKALAGKNRTLRVVEAPEQADLIVRIDSRNERKETASLSTDTTKSKDGRSEYSTTRADDRTVKVLHGTLIAGDFQMPLQDESNLSWRFAANFMATDVEHWAKENYGRLIEKRVAPRTGDASLQSRPAAPRQAAAPPASGSTDSTSIEPGMTEAQVTRAMGDPDKKVVFGKKSLWNYRGMQVVFEDGKVTDVKF